MDKQKFLEWYFGGSDQERQEMLISLGREVMENLFERGQYRLSVNDLISISADVYYDELSSKEYEEDELDLKEWMQDELDLKEDEL